MKTLQLVAASAAALVALPFSILAYMKWHERVSSQRYDANDISCELKDRLWTYRHHFQMPAKLLYLATSSNVGILSLDDGRVLVYNPVHLSPEIAAKIRSTFAGRDMLVVVPNREHLRFVARWAAMFNVAHIFCTQGHAQTVQTRLANSGVRFNPSHVVELSSSSPPPPSWPSELDFEIFHSLPLLTELVLLHKPSSLLLACDLVVNLAPADVRCDHGRSLALTYLDAVARVVDRGCVVPASYSFMVKDKAGLRRSAGRVGGWGWKYAFMAHGHFGRGGHEEELPALWRASVEERLLKA
jgi:hypothetical protein